MSDEDIIKPLKVRTKKTDVIEVVEPIPIVEKPILKKERPPKSEKQMASFRLTQQKRLENIAKKNLANKIEASKLLIENDVPLHIAKTAIKQKKQDLVIEDVETSSDEEIIIIKKPKKKIKKQPRVIYESDSEDDEIEEEEEEEPVIIPPKKLKSQQFKGNLKITYDNPVIKKVNPNNYFY